MACPDCHRSARTCWLMPCLGLEVALAQGSQAVSEWGRQAGATITPKETR